MGKRIIAFALTLILFFSLISVSSVMATTDEIGASPDNQDTWTGSTIMWANITASASGTLTTIGANMQSDNGGNIITAIYNSTGGLLGNSSSAGINVGWNDLTISSGSVSIVAGTVYKIAVMLSDISYVYIKNSQGAANGAYYKLLGTFAFPEALPSGATTYVNLYNMRMAYSLINILNSTSTNLLLNGTDADYNTVYNSSVNITAYLNASGTFYVSRNGTVLGSGSSPLKFYLNVSELANATYNITAYFPMNNTHNASSETHYIHVYKAAGTAPILTASPNWNAVEGTTTNVTCYGIYSVTLKKDGSAVANPYVATLPFGIYTFACTMAETGNYTSPTTSGYMSIFSGGFGCTNTSSYAFYKVINSTYMYTFLNFSYLVNQSFVKPDLSDVTVNTSLYNVTKNETFKYIVVNNSGADFVVWFGNYIVNNSYANYTGKWGNFTNITDYTEASGYYIVTFFDELTGVKQTPPDAVKSANLYCTGGVSAITIDNQSTRILLPTFQQLDSMRFILTYSQTESYYRDYLVDSAIEYKYAYLADAIKNQVLQMLFNLDDRTGSFGTGSVFRVKKYMGSTLGTITELPFDIELKAIAFLLSGDKYQLYVDNGVQERSIGDVYTDPSSLTKTITLQDIPTTNISIASASYAMYSDGVKINFIWDDPAALTNSVEFWVYNYTNVTTKTQVYYASSANHSNVYFSYVMPDVNQLYGAKWLVHHQYFGNDSNGGWGFFRENVSLPGAANNPFALLLSQLGFGNPFWLAMFFLIPIPLLMPRRFVGISAFLFLFVIAWFRYYEWITVDWSIIGLGLLIAILIEMHERKRWRA